MHQVSDGHEPAQVIRHLQPEPPVITYATSCLRPNPARSFNGYSGSCWYTMGFALELPPIGLAVVVDCAQPGTWEGQVGIVVALRRSGENTTGGPRRREQGNRVLAGQYRTATS